MTSDASAGSYLPVFIDGLAPYTDNTVYTIAKLAGIGFFLGLSIVLVSAYRTDKIWGKRVFKGALVLVIASTAALIPSAIATAVIFKSASNQNAPIYKTEVDHMNADLKQKYGATLSAPDRVSYLESSLASGDQKYSLIFSDGRKGDYFIRWDRETSEPTITDTTSPSANDLNRTKAKQ